MRRTLLALLFLLSGAAALCYEVAWTRHLVLVFGNTTRAVALLLGAYMLGLALGSEVGGRLADRSRRPAVWYAVFELAIAGFALAFPWLVDAVRAVYLGIGTSAPPVLFVLAFALLLVPTFCMGTTLPLLVRATCRDAAEASRDVGTLYAANVVGAVIGAAATGFVLMESAGVLGATTWAAAVNALVGVAGLLVARRVALAGTVPVEPPECSTGTVPVKSAAGAALTSAFVAGFVGLAAQVTWTRLLTFFLQGFTWTFTAILSTFLLGLALGGAVFGRLGARSKDPVRLLAVLQLLVAVATAGALLLLTHHLPLTRAMWETAGRWATDLGDRHRLALVLASGVVLLVPSFLMGGCLPLAVAVHRRGLDDLGARVGRLYAVNTLGCVAGSLAAGFVLQPWLGPSAAAAAVAVLALAGAVAVVLAARLRRLAVVATVAAAACAALLVAADPARPFLLRSHVFAGTKAREVALGRTLHGEVCTVSVVRNVRERFDLLYTDEFEAAGTKPEYRYMRMLAHLPVALARDPSRTLVVCFGTGTTSGSVAAHAAVRTLDVVEISPEVLAVADAFSGVNRDVLRGAGRTDLDLRVHVDDGRHFVLRSGAAWGVISLEPLMPYTPAAIHFYTRDFYELCRARLAPGGLMCQWIPLQGMSGDDFRRLCAAFVAVYPDSAMFFVDGAVALVGGPDGVELSWARVSERLSDPRVAKDLRSVGFAGPARALATWITGGEALRAFVNDVEPVTDERPVLEFHPIPPGVALPWLGQNLQHMVALRTAQERIPVVVPDTGDGARAREELFLAKRSGDHVLDGLLRVETSGFLTRLGRGADAMDELRAAREAFGTAVAVDPANETARRQWEALEREWWTIQAASAIDAGDFALAERHARRALEFRATRQADVAWTRLAEARNRAGRHDAALEAACEAVRRFPDGLEARAERGFARAALGDVEGAAYDYRRAFSVPRPDGSRGPVVLDGVAARLRQDAERAWTADTEGWGAFPAGEPFPAEGTISLDDALAERRPGKLTRRLALRIALSDRAPDDPAESFSSGIRAGSGGALSEDRILERIALLRDAGGSVPVGWEQGELDVGSGWLDHPSERVRRAAADALVELDPGAVADRLRTATGSAADVALAQAAGAGRDRRLVRPLLRLLRSDDLLLRRAARGSLFSLLGESAPHLASLDPDLAATTAYRRSVLDLEAWWAREEDRFEPR